MPLDSDGSVHCFVILSLQNTFVGRILNLLNANSSDSMIQCDDSPVNFALALMAMGAAGSSSVKVKGKGKPVRICSPRLKFRGHDTPGLLRQAPRQQAWGVCAENA